MYIIKNFQKLNLTIKRKNVIFEQKYRQKDRKLARVVQNINKINDQSNQYNINVERLHIS